MTKIVQAPTFGKKNFEDSPIINNPDEVDDLPNEGLNEEEIKVTQKEIIQGQEEIENSNSPDHKHMEENKNNKENEEGLANNSEEENEDFYVPEDEDNEKDQISRQKEPKLIAGGEKNNLIDIKEEVKAKAGSEEELIVDKIDKNNNKPSQENKYEEAPQDKNYEETDKEGSVTKHNQETK